MTGIWLVSCVVLWVLVLVGAAALLALAREVVALQRDLEMVKHQLAREIRQAGDGSCPCAPEARPVEALRH